MNDNVLRVGDRMFWSMELIRDTLDQPLQRTELLEVESIETDGDKKLVRMKRIRSQQGDPA